VPALPHWRRASDRAGIREPAARARLPAAERAAWQAFWADVDALIRGAPTVGEPPADPFAR
jgi:hypothetical protein